MTSHLISLRISKVLMKQFGTLTRSERDVVLAFLKRLQDNPFEEALIGNSEAHEDMFASTVGRHYLYWTIEANRDTPGGSDVDAPVVKVLGLEMTLRRRPRRKLDGEPRPLLKHLAGTRS
jgi:hypothetical protein